MKKVNIKGNKLSKKALRTISGGNGPEICMEGLCMVRGSDEIQIGRLDRNGFCC